MGQANLRKLFGGWLRQPFVQFVVIGAAIFGLWTLKNPEADAAATEIRVGAAELRWLHDTWVAQFGHAPSETEMRAAVRGYVDEEMRYREGLALGLDRDDTIVRRRLAQKYDFMLGAQAADLAPTDAQLAELLARHPDRYRQAARTSFCQVWFGDRAEGLAAARRTLAGLGAADADAPVPGREGLPFPRCYREADPGALARDFGDNFAEVVGRRLTVGAWQGPVESGYGYHLVIPTARAPGAAGTLETARAELQADWRRDVMEAAEKRQEAELARRYDVRIDEAALNRLVAGAAP